ncbi:hypothetical protein MHU86_787 [Fragilaria crotonensis]|nr:hypothetical protein MHU86_787 [Fragilaria crotonensis]
MADGTALIAPPVATPEDWTSASSAYGFHCETWLDSPTTSGPDWFTPEERSRRDANEYAYRQKGTKENWYRHISLGFFVFEDCFECDELWEKFETDPLQVHRSIWYNIRFHVDQEMNIPPKLNDWAVNVSRAYLSHFDPTTLHETDTLAHSWKTMPFMTSMEVEDHQVAWIPVPGRRRSKSPPTESVGDSRSNKSTTFPSQMPAPVNLINPKILQDLLPNNVHHQRSLVFNSNLGRKDDSD